MLICKWSGLVGVLFLGACASHLQYPASSLNWQSQTYWVRQSLYGGIFYDDDRYGLVSPEPFEKLTYLKSLTGDLIIPPPSHEVIPFGTRIQIQKVEWPTEENIIKRPLLTPRYLPWIYLTVAQDRGSLVTLNRYKTYRMLVPEDIRSEKGLADWLLNYFSKQDNNPYFLSLSPSEREAILKPAK